MVPMMQKTRITPGSRVAKLERLIRLLVMTGILGGFY